MAQAAAGAGVAAQATGGVIAAYGARREGRDREDMLRTQAHGVQIETQNDIEDLERTRVEILGSQRATFAASGVKVNVGSPMSVAAETNRRAAIQASRIRQAGGFRQTLFLKEASMVRRATNARFVSDLLSTAGGAAKSGAQVSQMS